MEKTGTFTSSDPLLNRIWSNAAWSIRGNTLSILTDCPQRSERYGWTGDAQIFCDAAMYMYDADTFYRDFVQDMIDIQNPETGAIPDMAPRNFHTGLDGSGGIGIKNADTGILYLRLSVEPRGLEPMTPRT